MKSPKNQGKLSRAQITDALDSVPVSHLLGNQATRQLTPKQRAFAVEVAKGSTKADAFRKAYPGSKSKHTLTRAPYIMSRDERIKAEIDKDLVLDKHPIASRTSMEVFWKQYLKYAQGHKRPKTLQTDKRAITTLQKHMPIRWLDDLTPRMIEDFKEHLVQRGLQPATINI